MLAIAVRADKAGELAAMPPLLEGLDAGARLKGAMIAVAEQGPDWLRTVTGKQPMHWAEVEPGFAAAATAPSQVTHDKGHGRIGQRHDTGWRAGQRRVPGEMRLRGAVRFIGTTTRAETAGRNRSEARYARSSRALTAPDAAVAV